MISKNVKVINKTGLHLKPAAVFCDAALRYKSSVTFTFGSYTGNAKSILSVLSACVKQGDVIEINCDGEDEDEAMRELVKVIEDGLGE